MNPQLEKKAKRAVIITIIILIISIFGIIKVSYAQKVIGTGYLIYTKAGHFESGHSFPDLKTANNSIDFYFTGSNINLERELQLSNFLNIRTESKEFYIEKKAIIKRRNGKLVYRRITNKRKRQLENAQNILQGNENK